jgi:predicted metalloprotease with PDZ domain
LTFKLESKAPVLMKEGDQMGEVSTPLQSSDDEATQAGIEKIHFTTFTNAAKNLECQVQWDQTAPTVVEVVPNGAAERQGVRKGDRILQVNGTETEGLSREQLLPILRQRPLTFKLESEAPVLMKEGDQMSKVCTLSESSESDDEENQAGLERIQYVETFTEAVKELAFEVEWIQPAPVVVEVGPDGAAERRGIRAGDRILEVNGAETEGLSREQLLPILRQRPLILKLECKVPIAMKESDQLSEISTHTLSETGVADESDSEECDALSSSSDALDIPSPWLPLSWQSQQPTSAMMQPLDFNRCPNVY